MASISINVFDPQPGKNAEALHLLKEAQEVISAFGARVQVAQLVRGGTPGQNSLIVENDDPESHGALLDKLYADQGFQQFMSRVQAAAVATPVRSVDYQEIPGCELSFQEIASAGVILASLFVVREGKQQQSLDRIQRWKTLMNKHGAKVRALQASVSDPFGLTASVAYFENFSQWGRIGKALGADREWQAFAAEIRGADASADFLRTSLFRIV